MPEGERRRTSMTFDWSERKARLLICAACRGMLPLFGAELGAEIRTVLDAAEEYADGRVSLAELKDARERGRATARDATSGTLCVPPIANGINTEALAEIAMSAAICREPVPWRGEMRTLDPYDTNSLLTVVYGYYELCAQSRPGLAPIPPFDVLHEEIAHRTVRFSPEWRTATVTALATVMYESRDFSAMPILADALQDAECEDHEILSHCRRANAFHVRGCWAVDLVLGKQ